MKYGCLIPLLVWWVPLFSQNCDEVAIDPVRYYEGSGQNAEEIQTYLVPCSNGNDLNFSVPTITPGAYVDPNPSTPEGIILVLLRENPKEKTLLSNEFKDFIYKDLNGLPLYFMDDSQAIRMSELLNLGNESNQFVLMPVLVSSMAGTNSDTWFEDDCVRIYPEYGLTLIESPAKEYEFTHFDEIVFSRWPVDTSMAEFFDFTFTDQETGLDIPFVMTDNRSFRLQFPKSKGIFNFELSWNDHECYVLEIGVNWEFPTVEVRTDTVAGFQNIEKCVPVRVFNFESVTGFDFQMSWAGDSLGYTTIKNIHPDLAPYLKIGKENQAGEKREIHIEWPSGLDTVTLKDSAILFEWCGRPLVEAGQMGKVGLADLKTNTNFWIYGLKTNSNQKKGGIYVQEDREIIYDLNQLCNTRNDQRRILLDVINDEAYPYFYSFNSPLVRDSTIHTIPFTIPDVPPGKYEFVIRDSFGYEIKETIIVRNRVPPDFELGIDTDRIIHPTCLNPWGGQIAVTLFPKDEKYQLDVLNDDAEFILDSVQGLVAGHYMIKAENDAGCYDILSYRLNNPREINVSWDDSQLILCPGIKSVFLQIEDQNPMVDTSLQFQVEGGVIHRIGDSVLLTDAGNYDLQLWNGDGCTLDTTVVVRRGPEQISVWDTTSTHVFLGDTLTYDAPEPLGLTRVTWDYDGISVGDRNGIKYVPQENGILNFRATVYDKCVYRDSMMVQIIKPDPAMLEFAFPNVFTPNGDGVNDYYRITPTREIQQILRMEVFDRYGNLIFKNDYGKDENIESRDWDGRVTGVDAPAGVYAVQVELLLMDGRREEIGYDVLLLR